MKILKRPSALNVISISGTIVVFFLLFTLSCTKKVGLETKAGVAQCDTVSYEQDIAPIVAANCSINGCHVQPTPPNGVMLNTYELFKTQAVNGRIKARVLDEDPTSMPPAGLTADQKKLIECWLSNGYLP